MRSLNATCSAPGGAWTPDFLAFVLEASAEQILRFAGPEVGSLRPETRIEWAWVQTAQRLVECWGFDGALARLKLTKVEREQIEAAAEILRPWGLAYEVVHTGKHPAMKVKGPKGGVWSLTIVCTPRNAGDAVALARQNAKRLVREINRTLGL